MITPNEICFKLTRCPSCGTETLDSPLWPLSFNYRETEHELWRLELFKATETWRYNPELQQSNLPVTHSFSGSGSSQRTHINGSCKQQQELQSNRHAGGLFLRLTDDCLTVTAEWSSTPFGGVSVLIRAQFTYKFCSRQTETCLELFLVLLWNNLRWWMRAWAKSRVCIHTNLQVWSKPVWIALCWKLSQSSRVVEE